MRIAIIGQAAFGEAVFRALRDRGEQIVAVSSVAGTAEYGREVGLLRPTAAQRPT